MSEDNGIQSWPYMIPTEDFLFECIVQGDPVPASRPRVSSQGHAYYPKRYTAYRDALTFYLQNTLKPLPLEAFLDPTIPEERRRYGVRVFFYRKSKQRSDVDNLLKSVLDGGTGIIWSDDCRVDEVFGKVFRSCDRPRVEILVYEVKPAAYNKICKQCGQGFDGFPCKGSTFCSAACLAQAMADRRVKFNCKFCGKEFSVLRCVARQHKVGFCSKPCNLRYWSHQRVMETSAKWKCVECGAQLKRADNKRCGLCERIRRGCKIAAVAVAHQPIRDEDLPF